MPSTQYQCEQCREIFEFLVAHRAEDMKCPRCAGRDIREMTACSLNPGPPRWEYVCPQCGGRFRIEAPRGPSEEKLIRCPRCESRNIRWRSVGGEACPPGG